MTWYVPAFVVVTVTHWPPANPSDVQLPVVRWIVSRLPAFVFAARVKVKVPLACRPGETVAELLPKGNAPPPQPLEVADEIPSLPTGGETSPSETPPGPRIC